MRSEVVPGSPAKSEVDIKDRNQQRYSSRLVSPRQELGVNTNHLVPESMAPKHEFDEREQSKLKEEFLSKMNDVESSFRAEGANKRKILRLLKKEYLAKLAEMDYEDRTTSELDSLLSEVRHMLAIIKTLNAEK